MNKVLAIAYYGKAVILAQLKKYEEALKYFDKAIESDPKFAEGWYGKGGLLYELCDYSSSEKAIKKSLEISPSFEASFIMGKIKMKEGDFKKSIEYFEEAKNIKPSSIEPTIWKIYAEFMKTSYPPKNIKEKEWEEKIEYQKGVSSQILEVEDLIKFLENKKEKTDEEEKAIPTLYYWLGIFYTKVGGYLSAVENFDKSIDASKELKKKYKKDAKSLGEIEEKAEHLLRYIWNTKINHSFWNWWLFSPKNLWERKKQAIFTILSSSLFLLIILPLVGSISFPRIKISLPEWNYWIASILTIFFILLSPLLLRIKAGSDIDVELSPPSEITTAPVSLMPIMEETMKIR